MITFQSLSQIAQVAGFFLAFSSILFLELSFGSVPVKNVKG